MHFDIWFLFSTLTLVRVLLVLIVNLWFFSLKMSNAVIHLMSNPYHKWSIAIFFLPYCDWVLFWIVIHAETCGSPLHSLWLESFLFPEPNIYNKPTHAPDEWFAVAWKDNVLITLLLVQKLNQWIQQSDKLLAVLPGSKELWLLILKLKLEQ